MGAAAIHQLIQGPSVHVFNELSDEQRENCELCGQERAVFHWIEQQGESEPSNELTICRVCAGMILLVGKPY